MTDRDDLAPRLTVAASVAVYTEAMGELRDAFRRIAAAEERLNNAFGNTGYGRDVRVPTSFPLSFDDPDRSLEDVRRQVWRSIVERLEVRRMMSIERWKQLDQELDKGDLPELTVESAEAMARGFAGNLREMLEEAIGEVFEWLRPPRSEYKRNSELEIGPRVVLRYVVEPSWGGNRVDVNHRYRQELIALENVFSALDGRGQVTKNYVSAIEGELKKLRPGERGETEYFEFRGYANRNLHLRFKRLDLLAKFNAIAGGRRLRPRAAEVA